MITLTDTESPEVTRLLIRLDRERKARQQTEAIAEAGMLTLYQKQAELQLLRTIAMAANETDSISVVMQVALDQICAFMRWPIGHALRWADDSTLVSMQVWHFDDAERFTAFRAVTEAMRFPTGVGLPGRVLASGKPAWISDVNFDQSFPRKEIAHTLGVKAGFCFPVRVGSTVAAALEFYSHEAVDLDETVLELMASIATQLSRVIERQLAQTQIREQAALLDMARDAIAVLDMNDCFLFWNQSAERLYGLKADEVIGKNAEVALRPGFVPADEDARQTLLSKGEWIGELRQTNKDGQEIIVESRWTLVAALPNRPKVKLIINTDVSARKKLEAQLMRTQRLESIGTLAGGIAHDLNNALTPILMAIELLRPKMAESEKFLLSLLEANARRGADLVKQVLSFARGTEGQYHPLAIGPLINELGKLLKQVFPRSIDICTEVPKDLWLVSGDATQLHQVLMNLCVNARDAMPRGGRLTITAANFVVDENFAQMHLEAHAGNYIVVSVEDSGTGIPPGIIDKIFDPFFTTKEMGQGTGLGLANVQAIVKSHRGFVNVYSEMGRGALFRVYLPVAAECAVAVPAPSLPKRVAGAGQLILVIEDDQAIRQITQRTLETGGYQVLMAEDGAAGLALFAERRQDIRAVLTDMMMPIMDGPATIKALHRMDPALRIIAVSGFHNGQKSTPNLPGVRRVLAKPFTADTLLSAIQETLADK